MPPCQGERRGFESRSVLLCYNNCMARKAKQKEVVEAPIETLSEALVPKVEEKSTSTLVVEASAESATIPEVELVPALVRFVRVMRDFEDTIHMVVGFEGIGTRKTQTGYRHEDIQDAYSLGVRVDSLIEAKITSDKYILNGFVDKAKEIDKTKTVDFSRFNEELKREGLKCRHNFEIKDLIISVTTGSAIAVLFEKIK